MALIETSNSHWCRVRCILGSAIIFQAGCNLSDPNYNDKMRYQMAHLHAADVLKAAGCELSPFGGGNYNLMEFWTKYYDEKTKIVHFYQLYDFLKICDKPGPDRFVIAYDTVTRKTYLRSDLRSNVNLDRLPATQPSR